MHKLKRETKAFRDVTKDLLRYSCEDGIILGRPSRKRKTITAPLCHINRAHSITLYPPYFDLVI